MVELLHPGVYVLEVPSGALPIQGVSTSTAAFIGVASQGPVPGNTLPNGRMAQPVLVTSFTDYSRNFGGYRPDSFLTYAARSFFDNGGHRLYVVRVANGAVAATATALSRAQVSAAAQGTWTTPLTISIVNATNGTPSSFDLVVIAAGQAGPVEIERSANLTPGKTGSALKTVNAASKFIRLTAQSPSRPSNSNSLTETIGTDGAGAQAATATTTGANGLPVTAKSPGSWANGNLAVSIADATGGVATNFNLVVKLKGVVVETFADVTFDSGGPPLNYARAVINAAGTGSKYIALQADFNTRPPNTAADVALANGTDGTGGTTSTWLLSPSSPLSCSAANEGKWGNAVGVAVADSSDRDPSNFRIVVTYEGLLGRETVETYDNVTFTGSPSTLPNAPNPADDARVVVNGRSQYVAFTADLIARPANSPFDASGRVAPTLLTGGLDGSAVTPAGFQGLEATSSMVTGTGLRALDKVTDVNLIAIPGQGEPATVSAGVDYCKIQRPLADCFFIGDIGTLGVPAARVAGAAPDINLFADVRDFATTGFGGTSLDKSAGDYGAIYYPWIWAADPVLGQGQNPRILLPPSGFMAGLYARIDNSRGVFKAPAGTEAGVVGALSPAAIVSDTDQDSFNPISVNIIRTVPGSGLVVWGTRTFGSDAAWRYVPVRRMAIFLRVSIYYGIQWAVFEPNDEPLWSSLRTNIRSFMLTQFRAGAFQGSTPDAAFFVKCDSATTTQQDIDLGIVNILVGFAPLKPAEFVVLKLSQKVNQPAT